MNRAQKTPAALGFFVTCFCLASFLDRNLATTQTSQPKQRGTK